MIGCVHVQATRGGDAAVNPWDVLETEVDPCGSLSDAAAAFVQAKREKERKKKERQRLSKGQGADTDAPAQAVQV